MNSKTSTFGNKWGIFLCAALTWLLLFSLPAWASEAGTAAEVAGKQGTPATDERRLDGEIEAARRAVAADRTSPTAHAGLGYLLLRKGALDEALASFDEALRLNPRHHESQTGKGIVLARKGDLRRAEQVLKDALALNPDPVRTHFELGLIYEKLGDLDRALAEFKEGLKKSRQGRK
jgi:tetratricopeptide (TPR) repeat protein